MRFDNDDERWNAEIERHDYNREAYGDPCPKHHTLRFGGDCMECDWQMEVFGEVATDWENPEACPSCGSLPGDGVKDSCNDPNGCGYWKKEAQRG